MSYHKSFFMRQRLKVFIDRQNMLKIYHSQYFFADQFSESGLISLIFLKTKI